MNDISEIFQIVATCIFLELLSIVARYVLQTGSLTNAALFTLFSLFILSSSFAYDTTQIIQTGVFSLFIEIEMLRRPGSIKYISYRNFIVGM